MTTTYASERVTVGEFLVTNWTDCPIAFPNDDLVGFPVVDGQPSLPQPTGNRADPARFLRVDFDYQSAEQITFGGDVEIRGVVEVALFVERGVGDGKLRAMGDALAALFRNAAIADTDGIQFMEPTFDAAGVGDEEDWFLQVCRIPFVRFKDANVS